MVHQLLLALLAAWHAGTCVARRIERRHSHLRSTATTHAGERLPLLPYPSSVTAQDSAPFLLSERVALDIGEGIPEDDLAVASLREHLEGAGASLVESAEGQEAGSIVLRLEDEDKDKEGYSLSVDEGTVELTAPSLAGLFYGVQTLKQLAIAEGDDGKARLPAVEIEDAPRFGWRGLHLDVSRHFFEATEVKRLLDVMAIFKLNRFQWHLTDDQGWRLPVDGYPRLTEIGADGVGGRRAYTTEDIKDVVSYAKARHIEVVPEIELPGHVQALLAAYPDLGNKDVPQWETPVSPWKEWGVSAYTLAPHNATWTFLNKVFDTVTELFPGSLVHMGGDEAQTSQWSMSELAKAAVQDAKTQGVQAIFNTRVAESLKARKRGVMAWNEALQIGGFPKDGIITAWQSGQEVLEAARRGARVINADQGVYYFDHYQSDAAGEPPAFGGYTSLENVYKAEPMPKELTEEQRGLVLGAQGQLWSEYFPNWKHVEYMAHPRSAALAERVWSSEVSGNDFADFKRRLRARLPDLDRLGVNYRKLDADR